MRKLLKTTFLVLSTLLFVTVVALWIASYVRLWDYMTPYEGVWTPHANVHRRIYSLLDGEFEYLYHEEVHFENENDVPKQLRAVPLSVGEKKSFLELPGFEIYQNTSLTRAFRIQHTGFAVDCWLMAAVFGTYPGFRIAMKVRAILRNRQAWRRGHCRKCNYDLRAHAAGGRCPECGLVIEDDSHPGGPPVNMPS